LVFANTDARFDPRFVERVIQPLLDGNNVFATEGAMHYWYDETNVRMAQRIHRVPLRTSLKRNTWLPMLDRRADTVTHVADATEVSGADMAVERWRFDALGRFDSRLPFGWETTELCWRAWLRGWRSVCVPDAKVFHKVGETARLEAAAGLVLRGVLGGRLLFSTKHLPIEIAIATWAQSVLSALVHPSSEKRKVVTDYGRLIPALLRERRQLYGTGRDLRHHFGRMLDVGADQDGVEGRS
jgi:GT2 family glycosyltransferase